MQHTQNALFPEITPFLTGFLKTSDGHQIYYEVSGNPQGYPVVFLHGGPGSGCNPGQRRFFDPLFYQIILVDQRGCGRSKPIGSTDNNTTAHLVDDLDVIRQKLSLEQWLIFGGSWGSTLALSYALKHPSKTSGLILRGIFLARPQEMQWFLGQITRFFPDVWSTLCQYLDAQPDNVLNAFEACIFSDDPSINIPAAKAWNAYESAIMRLMPKTADKDDKPEAPNPALDAIELSRARVQIHYIKHDCFVDGESILTESKKLKMPTTIVQGRYDMVCPPETAWALTKTMPHADFVMVPDAGHSAMETGTCEALVNATEHFKTLVKSAG